MADSSGSTIVGESILITGNLQGDEDLTVLGRVEGSLSLTKTLVVAESGVVKAEISVRNAIVSGIVVGNITASDSVEVTDTGRLVGDIKAPRVIVVAGARVRGAVDMGDLEAPRPSAPLPARISTDRGALSRVIMPARPTSTVPVRRPTPVPPPRRPEPAAMPTPMMRRPEPVPVKRAEPVARPAAPSPPPPPPPREEPKRAPIPTPTPTPTPSAAPAAAAAAKAPAAAPAPSRKIKKKVVVKKKG